MTFKVCPYLRDKTLKVCPMATTENLEHHLEDTVTCAGGNVLLSLIMMFSRLLFVCLSVLSAPLALCAQNDDEPKTIRVKRESNLAKAQFDNTQMRLFVIDRFGNARENRIVSYTLYVKGKKNTKSFTGFSNELTGEMISHLEKQKESTKIFFTGITVLDDADHAQKLPDVIEVWFPDCGNCPVNKKRN